jgi:MFS transporter, OCT family, solute carrier family 22 (organic cation transporter), member 4/5
MSTTEPLLSAGAEKKKGGKGPRVGIDEALSAHAGEFGRWQLRHFVAVSAAWALEALHTMVIIFADREPATVPVPCAAAGREWAGGGGSGAAASTVVEWGLVCGQRYKVGLAQAVFFAGCMIGQCRASSPLLATRSNPFVRSVSPCRAVPLRVPGLEFVSCSFVVTRE